jgi:fructose-1,6-bisphosphatase/inositol monophosphatase family enzyme
VLGEEGTSRDGTSGRTWVIDPVDGTYNYVAGLDWWCSALALLDGPLALLDGPPASEGAGGLVLGAIHHPATGRTFIGGPGWPSTVDGVPLAPIADRPLAESCLATYLHPPGFGGPDGAAFERMARGAATLRMLGSASLDAAAIASGGLQVRCQHSMPPWDDLPGAALILGAGGATARVSAGGVIWHAAGAPAAVSEVAAALSGSGKVA